MLDQYATTGGASGSGLLSLDPGLAASRKRGLPSTDSLDDGSKRMHEFTESVPDNYWTVASSPPQPVNDDDATDDDMDTDDDDLAGRTIQCTQETVKAYPEASSSTFVGVKLGGRGLDHSFRTRSLRDELGVPAIAARSRGSLGSFGSFSMPDVPVKALIDQIIDNPEEAADNKGCIALSLENRGLEELPEVIGDLRDLVFFGNKENDYSLQLYLSKNSLTHLPLGLFNLDRLTVLSLRDNQLAELSPLIGNLTNLNELHLSGNQLKFLPAELLELPLSTLTVYPNDLIPLPDTGSMVMDSEHCIYRVHTYNDTPTLQELSLRALALNAYTDNMSRSLNIHPVYRKAAEIASNAYKAGTRCSSCGSVYVTPAAETMEWWNIFGQLQIPFRRAYCQRSCLEIGILNTPLPSSSPRR